MKTSQKRSYSVIENEGFGLVFAKTRSIISGTGVVDNSHKFITGDNDTDDKLIGGDNNVGD